MRGWLIRNLLHRWRHFGWLGVVACLAACGAETSGVAATAGTIKKQEIEQGQQTMEQARQRVDQAVQQMQQAPARAEPD